MLLGLINRVLITLTLTTLLQCSFRNATDACGINTAFQCCCLAHLAFDARLCNKASLGSAFIFIKEVTGRRMFTYTATQLILVQNVRCDVEQDDKPSLVTGLVLCVCYTTVCGPILLVSKCLLFKSLFSSLHFLLIALSTFPFLSPHLCFSFHSRNASFLLCGIFRSCCK